MIVTGVSDLADAVVPLLALALLAVFLPFLLVEKHTRSQARLARGIAGSALLTWAASLALVLGLHLRAGNPVEARFAADPLAAGLDYAGKALVTALAWVPPLLLVWLGRAQAVEKRRGEDRAKGGA